MRNRVMVCLAAAAVLGAGMVAAQGMGGGNGLMAGSGMLRVASDGSVLVVRMEAGMMGGGQQGMERSVTDISAAGSELWSTSFDSGWPMMLTNDGDLVVVVLAANWWMGGTGDGGGSGPRQVTLVGLDLGTGAERWRTPLEGDMASPPQFAPDGTRFYVSVRDVGGMGGPGNAPMHQGDAYGSGAMMSTKVVAIGRDGQVEWTLDLSGGPPKVGRRP